VNRSRAKFALRDFDGVIADCNQALQLNPDEIGAYDLRGLAKRLQKDLKGAIADFNQALELDADHALAYSFRGLTKDNLKDYDGALADCAKACALDPQSPLAYENLGYVQNDLAQFQAALESFRQSVQLDPLVDYPPLRIWLLRTRLGETDDATKELAAHLNQLRGAQRNDWAAQIGRFLIGTTTEDDLLNLANTNAPNPKAQAGRLCQACYYAAMKHLLTGDKDGATTLFKKCLGTGEKGYVEYVSAGAELNALKK
jgi:lipoprotein NlpI